jgi:hypothetical protein
MLPSWSYLLGISNVIEDLNKRKQNELIIVNGNKNIYLKFVRATILWAGEKVGGG